MTTPLMQPKLTTYDTIASESAARYFDGVAMAKYLTPIPTVRRMFNTTNGFCAGDRAVVNTLLDASAREGRFVGLALSDVLAANPEATADGLRGYALMNPGRLRPIYDIQRHTMPNGEDIDLISLAVGFLSRMYRDSDPLANAHK